MRRCIPIRGQFPQRGGNNECQDLLPQILQVLVRVVLAGDHHAGDPVGQAEHILHGHLCLAVRLQPADGPCFPGIGEQASQAVGQHSREGEKLVRLAAGVAVQDTLVSSSGLLLLGNSPGDIAALGMGDDLHFVVGAAIARFPHRPADKGGNVRQLCGGDLAGHEDLARCGQDLTGHTGGWVAAEAGIQNCVRDGIAQLVRVSLGDRLCGLNVFISHVIFLSWDDFSPLVLSPEQ